MSPDKYPRIFLRQIEAIVYIFPNFQNRALCEKYLKDHEHNSLHLWPNYVRIFVLGHYLFLVAHSFPRAIRSRKTVRYSDQIMSEDKYPSMFSRQMEVIIYIYPKFQNCARCEKDLKDNKHGSYSLLGTVNVRGQIS